MIRIIALAVTASLLASCANRPGPSRTQIDRALTGALGEAQPSKVVAAEIAFARKAQDDGQWTAFRAFAAPGAIIHGRKGPILADTFLAGLADPEEAVRWAPRTVWMSCDSTLAVSQGRFRDPEGKIGSFITVWQRQQDREYRWFYDVAVLDDPQPPARSSSEPEIETDIVVSALSSIKGLVSDCARGGLAARPPAPPALAIPAGTRHAAFTSRDGTLRWRWEHPAEGERRFVADFYTGGAWEVALDQSLGLVSPAE